MDRKQSHIKFLTLLILKENFIVSSNDILNVNTIFRNGLLQIQMRAEAN